MLVLQIASNGSNGLMFEAPPIGSAGASAGSSSAASRQSSVQPSPLTQELQSMYHPPGAPVGGRVPFPNSLLLLRCTRTFVCVESPCCCHAVATLQLHLILDVIVLQA